MTWIEWKKSRTLATIIPFVSRIALAAENGPAVIGRCVIRVSPVIKYLGWIVDIGFQGKLPDAHAASMAIALNLTRTFH